MQNLTRDRLLPRTSAESGPGHGRREARRSALPARDRTGDKAHVGSWCMLHLRPQHHIEKTRILLLVLVATISILTESIVLLK